MPASLVFSNFLRIESKMLSNSQQPWTGALLTLVLLFMTAPCFSIFNASASGKTHSVPGQSTNDPRSSVCGFLDCWTTTLARNFLREPPSFFYSSTSSSKNTKFSCHHGSDFTCLIFGLSSGFFRSKLAVNPRADSG
jgi:hypothetical protein